MSEKPYQVVAQNDCYVLCFENRTVYLYPNDPSKDSSFTKRNDRGAGYYDQVLPHEHSRFMWMVKNWDSSQ